MSVYGLLYSVFIFTFAFPYSHLSLLLFSRALDTLAYATKEQMNGLLEANWKMEDWP